MILVIRPPLIQFGIEQVFDMLIFPEYAEKLGVAFCEMITDSEAWSAMAEFLVEWAECGDGPLAFSEAFIIASRLRDGEKVIVCALSYLEISTLYFKMMIGFGILSCFQPVRGP